MPTSHTSKPKQQRPPNPMYWQDAPAPPYTLVINRQPITKKNGMQITRSGGLIPSKQWREYKAKALICGHGPVFPIDYPVNVKALYYRGDRRRCDLANLHEALHDLLVWWNIVEDDNFNIIRGTDGSRVLYDKENPRTEIVITRMEE